MFYNGEAVGSIILPLVELVYYISYNVGIECPPFETLYEIKCKSSLCWDVVGEKEFLGLDYVQI